MYIYIYIYIYIYASSEMPRTHALPPRLLAVGGPLAASCFFKKFIFYFLFFSEVRCLAASLSACHVHDMYVLK
jgi:hypothetical protein